MKAGWKVKALGEVVQKLETVDPRKEPDVSFCYIDVSSVSKETLSVEQVTETLGSKAPSRARRKVRTGDTIFATIRPTLKRIAHIGLEHDEAICSTGYFVLRAVEGIEARYIYYYLQSADFGDAMEALQKGASYPAVTDGEVRQQPIPLPPLEEQKRIVAVLDAAFEGLTRARTHIETNLQNARELFETALGSVFDNADPTWSTGTIGDFVENGTLEKPLDGNHGETHPKKKDFQRAGVPFVMASDLIGGIVDQENCYFIARGQADSLRKGFAKDGDVLISHKGTIGRVARLKTNLDYVMLTPQVTYYRVAQADTLNAEFVYYFFQSSTFLRAMRDQAKDGATRAYIGITKQLDLPFSFPDLASQRRLITLFDQIGGDTERLIKYYETKLQDLDDLRQSLLARAFAGELT